MTAWNEGEEFASFGIGHFIWYPETEKIVYEESFPQLIAFMSANDVNIPKLLYRGDKIYMPWTNRAEFINDFNGLKMLELRRFLAKTIDFQVLFMIERMESTLARITAITEAQKRETVKRQFYRMYNSQYGVYSLIDYINFKGAGVIGSESYNGYGWGLRQVLENMEDNGEGSEINDFVKSAKFVLKRRVINSPKERNENRWLKGWLKRVGSYTSIGTETGIKK